MYANEAYSSIFHRDNITLDAAVISIGSAVLGPLADEAIPQGGREWISAEGNIPQCRTKPMKTSPGTSPHGGGRGSLDRVPPA